MLAWLKRVELRQYVGLAMLVWLGVLLSQDWSWLWSDLNGTTGLVLLLLIGLLTPRKWLAEGFLVVAMGLAGLGLYWLVLDVQGFAKSSTYWGGFFFAAVVFAVCAIVMRSQRSGLQ